MEYPRGELVSSDSDDEEAEQVLRRMDSGRQRHRLLPQTQGTIHELMNQDHETFRAYLGLSRTQFWKLFSIIQKKIKKYHTRFPQVRSIRPRTRLIIFLRFLCTGRFFSELSHEFIVPRLIIETIANETSTTIQMHIGTMTIPTLTTDVLAEMARKFNMLLNISNCIGIINISQITLINGTTVDCLLLVDAEGRIILIDVGKYNLKRKFDQGIKMTKLWPIIEENKLPPTARDDLPLVFVGEGFTSAKVNFLWKYPLNEAGKELGEVLPEEVFNERIGPILDVGKMTMARLQERWEIFRGLMPVEVVHVESFVTAACSIYNLFFTPTTLAPLDERHLPDYYIYPSDLKALRDYVHVARTTNQSFMNYFFSQDGIESWQWAPVIRQYLANR